MWDFSDNAVKRVDKGGTLDSDGSNGTDGILGPYRQRVATIQLERYGRLFKLNLYYHSSFKGSLLLKMITCSQF